MRGAVILALLGGALFLAACGVDGPPQPPEPPRSGVVVDGEVRIGVKGEI